MSEKTEIFKVYFAKPTEAYWKLSEKERTDLISKSTENLAELGAETLLTCALYWSEEEYAFFGVEKFPSIKEVIAHGKFLAEKYEWSRYFEAKSYLGTKYP